jgi:Ni/Fe-hydrogenase 1 B-type cytochrome subunit
MNINRQQVFVWSRKVRLFHWINVIAILLLITIGTVILNGKAFGLSNEGKVLLKTIHVLVGYVFASNLIFRLIIAFVGKGYERWHKILPFKKGFKAELVAFTQGKQLAYKGHSPAGKLMVLALLSVMTVQMISGLVIAGTDIYSPPLWSIFC